MTNDSFENNTQLMMGFIAGIMQPHLKENTKPDWNRLFDSIKESYIDCYNQGRQSACKSFSDEEILDSFNEWEKTLRCWYNSKECFEAGFRKALELMG